MKHSKARAARPPERRPSSNAKSRTATAEPLLPVVGFGASAGGLDAFKRLFSAMPADTGVAFVLIQHLDPTRESLTADLVGTYTRMPVLQVEDGTCVEANRVYVIPPNKYLSIEKRTLRLTVPAEIDARVELRAYLFDLTAYSALR